MGTAWNPQHWDQLDLVKIDRSANPPTHQRAEVTLDPQDGTLSVDTRNMTAMDQYLGRIVQIASTQEPLDAAKLDAALSSERVQALVDRIVAGHDTHWDGHNTVGTLTDDAETARNELTEVIDDCIDTTLGLSFAEDIEDLESYGITADTTPEQIARLAAEAESESAEQGAKLVGMQETLEAIRDRLLAERREAEEDIAYYEAEDVKGKPWGDYVSDFLRDRLRAHYGGDLYSALPRTATLSPLWCDTYDGTHVTPCGAVRAKLAYVQALLGDVPHVTCGIEALGVDTELTGGASPVAIVVRHPGLESPIRLHVRDAAYETARDEILYHRAREAQNAAIEAETAPLRARVTQIDAERAALLARIATLEGHRQ